MRRSKTWGVLDLGDLYLGKNFDPPSHSVSKMNSAAVSNNGLTRVSFFLFPPHHDTAGDVCRSSDTTAPILLAKPSRTGVMVGTIDVELVEADFVDADSE